MAAKTGSAVEQLAWHYEHPFAQAIDKAGEGIPVAGITSNTVPWELLRAAGYFPLILNPSPAPASFAGRFMEAGVFGGRIRRMFDGIASGAWPFLNLVVIPRTSEEEHKLFLYLREVVRQGFATGLPDIHFYNLLHARSDEAEAYGLERTHELKKYLEGCVGRAIEEAGLLGAAEESNRAARAIRRLLDFRGGPQPRLSGTEALALIGAVYFMDRAEYAQLANEAADELSCHPPLRGARILIKGSPLHHTGLHRAIESHRAIVVGEDDWWGSRALAREITPHENPVQAVFERYYFEAPSPRVFPGAIEWFLAASANVDGVIFYLSPEDDVLGWEYPGWRETLADRGIPSLLVREDAEDKLSHESHQRIDDFVTSIAPRS